MAIVLLVISAICFISAWGIHMLAKSNNLEFCGYLSVPVLCSIPWISGFVLAVIPEVLLFELKWYWMFLINIPFTFLLGSFIGAFMLRRFASGKGAGWDMLISMIVGIITLVIGAIIQ